MFYFKFQNWKIWIHVCVKSKESMSVSEQQHTYLSPNPTLTPSCYQLTAVGLGEGWVHCSSETEIAPK